MTANKSSVSARPNASPETPPAPGGPPLHLSAPTTSHSSAEPSDPHAFRPDIEGLRAVAVLLVLAYHAGVPGLSGGYVGVDVFFVVSGFLITGLIVRELERTGTVSLPAFYARRARRLLPAAAFVLVVTVLVSAIVLPPLRVPDVAGDGVAAALYASNIRFALQSTDYLQSALDPSPLLHYWSLGVEEQFYLFWPALLLLVARGRPRPTVTMATTVIVVGIASLALAIVLTGIAAPWAFYSLPSRAWELALGAVIALAARRWVPGASLAIVAGALGLALIGLAGVVFDMSTSFPGVAALLPTAGAALILVAGLRRPMAGASRVLALRPFRFLGRISYSLYLWHWPVLILPAAALGTGLPLRARLGLALLVIPIAAASQRWIEEPIRHGRLAALRPRRTLAIAGAASLIVATLAVGTGMAGLARLGPIGAAGLANGSEPVLVVPGLSPPSGGSPGPARPSESPPPSALARPSASPPSAESLEPGPVPANLVPTLAAARDDLPRIYDDGCHLSFTDTTSGPCAYGDLSSRTTVVLFGDSHAAQWFPTLERLAIEREWRLLSLTKSACPAADATVYNSALNRAYTECDTWRRWAFARIAAVRPYLVVISDSRGHVFALGNQRVPSSQREDLWQQALDRTIRALPVSAKIVVIGDTPLPAVDVPVCLSSHLDNATACANPLAKADDPERTASEEKVALADGATFIDPTPWLCPADVCPAVIGRILVFRDTHHMTATYARALAPYLGPALPDDP